MKELKRNDKGISLVEVIVSIAILAIIAVPLLSYFASAAGYNARAKNTQTAVTLAQSIMEQCKDSSMENIAKGFHVTSAAALQSEFHLVDPAKIMNPTDSSKPEDMVGEIKTDGTAYAKGSEGSFVSGQFTTANSSDGKLYYTIRNIQENGNGYDAVITVNTNRNAGDAYYTANTDTLYNIKPVQGPNHQVAIETTQNTLGVYAMKNLNIQYCDSVNLSNSGNPSWINKVPVDDSVIWNAMKRDIYIDIDYSTTDSVKASIYYKYYCPGVEGCPSDSTLAILVDPPLFSETVKIADLKNLYLFFQKINNTAGNTVNVTLDIDTLAQGIISQKMNLYLICQATDLVADAAPAFNLNIVQIHNSYSAKIAHLYSNAASTTLNGVSIVPDNYITASSSLRMMNITIDIYKGGELKNPQFLYASLSSTKEE